MFKSKWFVLCNIVVFGPSNVSVNLVVMNAFYPGMLMLGKFFLLMIDHRSPYFKVLADDATSRKLKRNQIECKGIAC
jgi:hypothetical protein